MLRPEAGFGPLGADMGQPDRLAGQNGKGNGIPDDRPGTGFQSAVDEDQWCGFLAAVGWGDNPFLPQTEKSGIFMRVRQNE